MRLKSLLVVLAAGVLAIGLTSAGALAQAAPQGGGPVVKSGPGGIPVTLKVRVNNMKAMKWLLSPGGHGGVSNR